MGSPRAGGRKNRLVTSLGDWELLPSAPFLPSCHSCHTLVHRPWACPGQVLGRDEQTHLVLEGLSLYPEEGARSFQEEVLLEGGLKGGGG